MSNINFFYLIPFAATIFVAGYTLLIGKNTAKNAKTKYLVLPVVLSILIGSFAVTQYYEHEFDLQNIELQKMLSHQIESRFDTIKMQGGDSIERRKRYELLIDSLKKQNEELNKILSQVKKQEKVIGEKTDVKNEIRNKIDDNKNEIGAIEKYNQLLDKNILKSQKGYMSSGHSSNFQFDCPNDVENDSLILKLKFNNDELVAKIEYVYISFSERIEERKYNLLKDEIYQPQIGVNGFKIKNFFKAAGQRKIDLEVGYVLRSETNKDYPRMERIVCKNY